MKRYLAIAAAVIGALLTGCGTTGGADVPSQSSYADAFDKTWDVTTEKDKDSMCWGVSVLGKDFAAGQMKDIDHPEIIGDLMAAKCKEEGR